MFKYIFHGIKIFLELIVVIIFLATVGLVAILELSKTSSGIEITVILLLVCVVVLLYAIYKRLYLILEDTAETRAIARQYKKREFDISDLLRKPFHKK